MSEQGKTGLEIRREVMGDAFVERAMGNATAFTQPLQDFVNEHAWGSVWAREALPRKTRSLITLAALTALKCPQELKGHVRGALNNGCTVEEIREALLHCAVYAGVPAAIDAFRAAQEAIDPGRANSPPEPRSHSQRHERRRQATRLVTPMPERRRITPEALSASAGAYG
ncbi:TPA: carboxymuconolactone decarboxylase family protein [Pseudomonas aeruginosa]|nr:hypothetical protein CTT40_05321 [Pseudomonas aeruginosa]HCF6919378.1 carboxymuconolactone decarboxylase family protein [Pseudomonas aeruginosa]